MEKELTEQDLQQLVLNVGAAFDAVSVTELNEAEAASWQDDGLLVDYEMRNGQVECVLRRRIRAAGKAYQLQMSAPLAGNTLPEDRMTERERELCRDDMNHDFLSGVFNRRYLETVFRTQVEQWAAQGRNAAVALVSLDRFQELQQQYGQPTMDQIICYVANQWKKHYYQPEQKVVCRLTGSIFVVGCVDRTEAQLEEEMRSIYQQMPCVCTTSIGRMCRVPFTLSVACAGSEEVSAQSWDALYALADQRVRAAADAGGNQVLHVQA